MYPLAIIGRGPPPIPIPIPMAGCWGIPIPVPMPMPMLTLPFIMPGRGPPMPIPPLIPMPLPPMPMPGCGPASASNALKLAGGGRAIGASACGAPPKPTLCAEAIGAALPGANGSNAGCEGVAKEEEEGGAETEEEEEDANGSNAAMGLAGAAGAAMNAPNPSSNPLEETAATGAGAGALENAPHPSLAGGADFGGDANASNVGADELAVGEEKSNRFAAFDEEEAVDVAVTLRLLPALFLEEDGLDTALSS